MAWLTLNRPGSLNALTDPLVSELARQLESAGAAGEVRVIVLRGSAGNFCSGLDLKAELPGELTPAQVAEKLARFQAVIRAIVSSPKPCLACVEGAAVGFGADLALACDLRVLGESAYLQEKFVDIGLMPDGGGTFWLPRLLGLGRGLELLMLGTRIDANTAKSYGLANRVAADAVVANVCQELALELSHKAPLALGAIKQAARHALGGSLEDALEREQQGQAKLAVSRDFREGVAAWTERRPAQFEGR